MFFRLLRLALRLPSPFLLSSSLPTHKVQLLMNMMHSPATQVTRQMFYSNVKKEDIPLFLVKK
jgi:hypothetical protein